jgi:nitroreductase
MRQSMCATADAIFFMATDWKALQHPDGDRGYRYASLLAGIAGEGLYLQATALGLGACGVGGFTESEVASIMGRDPAKEAIFYGVVVGR